MTGETAKAKAIVLDVRPWSRTSHVVTWLVDGFGTLATVVKGATRPKSPFLGQYDFFYTCEIVFYLRSPSGVHILKECAPLKIRDGLRGRWRECALAGYIAKYAVQGQTASEESWRWFRFFDALFDLFSKGFISQEHALSAMLRAEKGVVKLSGVEPDLSSFDPAEEWSAFSLDDGRFSRHGRCFRLNRDTVAALRFPEKCANVKNLLDALRFYGIFLQFHLDCPVDVRRSVLKILTLKTGENK